MKTIHDQNYLELISNLRRVRKAENISQDDLSKRLGKSQSFISKIECGDRRIDIIELLNICACIGVKLEQIIPKSYTKLI